MSTDEKSSIPTPSLIFGIQFAMWVLPSLLSRTLRSSSSPATSPGSVSQKDDDTETGMSGTAAEIDGAAAWDEKQEMGELDPSFVLKVLVAGEPKAGKSTVANALLRASYCEVSPIKPTGTITEYRLIPDDDVSTDDRVERQRLILERSRKSNTTLEGSNEASEGAYPLRGVGLSFETRPDTQVSIVDTPAISNPFSLIHINDKAEDYDVKVFVLDVTKDNHDELIDLVDRSRTASSAAMVILANKVDQIQYPDDASKHEERLSKLKKSIENKLRTELLSHDDEAVAGGIFFIPLCASQAAVARIAENSTKSEPIVMSDDQMTWLLRFSLGQDKIDVMSGEAKRAHACAMVLNGGMFGTELVSGTNFDSFTNVLTKIMGNEETQVALIRRQLVNSLNAMQPEFGVALKMEADFERFEVIDNAWGHIRTAYWKLFDGLESKTIDSFESSVNIKAVEDIVTELEEYVAYVGRLVQRGVITGEDQVQEECEGSRRVLEIVIKICDIISSKAYEWDSSGAAYLAYHRSVPFRAWMTGRPTWKNISPYDWNTLIATIESNISRKDFRGTLVQALQKLEDAKRFGPFNQNNSSMRNDFAVMVRLSSDAKAKNYVYLVDVVAWDDVVKRISNFLEPDADDISSRRSSRSRCNSSDMASITGESTASARSSATDQVVIEICDDVAEEISLSASPRVVCRTASGIVHSVRDGSRGKRKRSFSAVARKRFMLSPKSP